HCLWECKMVPPLWKTVWQFLSKLNIVLPWNPAIVLLGIHPNDVKSYIPTKSYTQMFIAALFIIAKTWKEPRRPSVGGWINELWYIQTLEYYSVLKRNELSSQEKTWRELKCILLSG
ncbi:LORF2 protein, partial [Crocuta crocuta]